LRGRKEGTELHIGWDGGCETHVAEVTTRRERSGAVCGTEQSASHGRACVDTGHRGERVSWHTGRECAAVGQRHGEGGRREAQRIR